jgi:hypothetical protein
VRALRRWTFGTLAALAMLAGAFVLWATLKGRPQDLPWTELDLADPPGLFTGRKLAGLTRDFPRCEALMKRAGVRYTVLPEMRDGEHCGYADGVRFAGGGSRRVDYLPADLRIACPVAAGLALWEWNVVQPAAIRHFGKRVSAIEHYGSYSCRRIVGRGNGNWSQHATADAIDIRAFRLADATRISVKQDWKGGDPAREAFLREVRTGACRLFTIVLSPDYNEAHADHFHMDQSARGEFGWRGCW